MAHAPIHFFCAVQRLRLFTGSSQIGWKLEWFCDARNASGSLLPETNGNSIARQCPVLLAAGALLD
jgi:hypothetical protein